MKRYICAAPSYRPLFARYQPETHGRFTELTLCGDDCSRLCRMLADAALSDYQHRWLHRLIRKRCDGLSDGERNRILCIAQSYCACRNRLSDPAAALAERLCAFLRENDRLELDGFFRFRTAEDRLMIRRIVDRAAQDYLTELEYREFIAALRRLAELRPCAEPTVQILPTDHGYRLLDGAQHELEPPVSGEEAELSAEDALLSRLLILSPNHIILHRRDRIGDKNFTNTLLNIFGTKLHFCGNCPFCLKNK